MIGQNIGRYSYIIIIILLLSILVYSCTVDLLNTYINWMYLYTWRFICIYTYMYDVWLNLSSSLERNGSTKVTGTSVKSRIQTSKDSVVYIATLLPELCMFLPSGEALQRTGMWMPGIGWFPNWNFSNPRCALRTSVPKPLMLAKESMFSDITPHQTCKL